jgi:hypothetical protein
MVCIGYRDIMDKEQFVWQGMASRKDAPSLGRPEDAAGSAEEMKKFLEGVQASGGGDFAEDVLGGLGKVADMLDRDGLRRNCVLFHICDAPAHGREFHDIPGDHADFYPDGPTKPLGNARSPEGRTAPWMDEAKQVLKKLKRELNVTK